MTDKESEKCAAAAAEIFTTLQCPQGEVDLYTSSAYEALSNQLMMIIYTKISLTELAKWLVSLILPICFYALERTIISNLIIIIINYTKNYYIKIKEKT